MAGEISPHGVGLFTLGILRQWSLKIDIALVYFGETFGEALVSMQFSWEQNLLAILNHLDFIFVH